MNRKSRVIVMTGTPWNPWNEVLQVESNQELSWKLERALDPSWKEEDSEFSRIMRLVQEGQKTTNAVRFEVEEGDACRADFSEQKTDLLTLPSMGFYASLNKALIRNIRWIVFWEDPIKMIFRMSRSAENFSSRELLTLWLDSARQLLNALRKHRSQIHLVNLDHGLKHPLALEDLFQNHFEFNLQISKTPKRYNGGKNDDGIRALFEHASHNLLPELRYTLDELSVSSLPLNDEDQVTENALGTTSTALFDGLDYIHGYHHFLGKDPIRDLEQAKREIDELQGVVLQNQRTAQSGYELLLIELQDAFKESECHFEHWKKAEATGNNLLLRIDSVVRGAVVDDISGRYIDYEFQGVEFLGRSWGSLRIRLVKQGGCPGIAIFSSVNANVHPLYSWEPAGTENNFPYMLFLPKEPASRDALVRATTSDLIMVHDIAAAILSDLKVNGVPEEVGATNWIYEANRLIEELDDLPERLHYDHVKTEIKPEGEICFEVINASFRWKYFGVLKFSWNPKKEEKAFVMHHAPAANPELSSWPRKADGSFFDEFNLLLGNKLSDKAKLLWGNFTRKEKVFLLMIISEIPNFLFHAARQHPQQELDLKKLNKKAHLLHQRALQRVSLH